MIVVQHIGFQCAEIGEYIKLISCVRMRIVANDRCKFYFSNLKLLVLTVIAYGIQIDGHSLFNHSDLWNFCPIIKCKSH